MPHHSHRGVAGEGGNPAAGDSLVHIHRIMKERDDLIRGALPRVLLVRMCVVCTIDSYGGEGTDVLVEAKRTRCWLRAVYTCDIDSLGEYIVTADSFIHAVPNREQLLRPRTPRGAKGNEHELTPRHKSGEVAGPSRRLRVLRLSGRLALIARLSALGAHKGGQGTGTVAALGCGTHGPPPDTTLSSRTGPTCGRLRNSMPRAPSPPALTSRSGSSVHTSASLSERTCPSSLEMRCMRTASVIFNRFVPVASKASMLVKRHGNRSIVMLKDWVIEAASASATTTPTMDITPPTQVPSVMSLGSFLKKCAARSPDRPAMWQSSGCE
eukprot:scaffold2774_cov137-Isochrysis_galbana.AAC.10